MALGFVWTDVRRRRLDATALIVGQMFFMGGGLGLVNAPATEPIMGALPPDKAGVGSAVNDTTRELGGTLGVAVVGSLFASVYASRLGELLIGSPVPPDAVDVAQQSAGAGFAVAEQTNSVAGPEAAEFVHAAVDDAFMRGFHAGSWVSAAVVAVGAVVAWRFLPARSAAQPAAANAAAAEGSALVDAL